MADKAIEPGKKSTERYLPKAAWAAMSKAERKKTDDKKKREITYDNAVLKVYDVPVAYFPKFFHPDPTVKRRTGFLVPSIKNSSNFGNYLSTPFFMP